MPLERRRDGGRYRLRARAGHGSLHKDLRKIHLRHRRKGELEIGEGAGEHDGEGKQRGGDGPPDEGGGDIHSTASGSGRA